MPADRKPDAAERAAEKLYRSGPVRCPVGQTVADLTAQMAAIIREEYAPLVEALERCRAVLAAHVDHEPVEMCAMAEALGDAHAALKTEGGSR